MHQRILALFLAFYAQLGFADDPSRYSLKGTITADPRDSESAGVAMLEDTHANKTIVVRMGQVVPGSRFVLEKVARKSVVLRLGSQTVTLYRNAWDGNRVTTASRARSERPSNPRRSSNERDATRSRVYGESGRLDNRDEFRAPPPLPPVLPPAEVGDADAEGYREGEIENDDRGAYPADESQVKEIPGVYPDSY